MGFPMKYLLKHPLKHHSPLQILLPSFYTDNQSTHRLPNRYWLLEYYWIREYCHHTGALFIPSSLESIKKLVPFLDGFILIGLGWYSLQNLIKTTSICPITYVIDPVTLDPNTLTDLA